MTHPLFGTHLPVVAILRGITPAEADAAFDALVKAGITLIEVPLNSPDPFGSIEKMVKRSAGRAKVGAGTVLTEEHVVAVKDVGGELIVSPNADPAVIRKTKALRMDSYPGVFTPTEAFAALAAGADALKFFPAELIGTSGIKAMKAVLPKDVPVLAVGGANETNFAEYIQAGCAGFGIGSNIYKPGMTAAEIGERASKLVAAFKAAASMA
ncbi:MAG: 2-dehydro-3-deoxy-6-phosphogalactonate aldolase [Candidatus Kaistia colombiensis]|nr:MAG: 2-dehydro-3-deoxy-6-phosphogalactonate aldolase [Kaistia sp.]